jgi:hypothetical protein
MTVKQKKKNLKTIEQELLEKELVSHTKYKLRREEYKNKYSREQSKHELNEALDEYEE